MALASRVVAFLICCQGAIAGAQQQSAPAEPGSVVKRMQEEAETLRPLVKSELGQAFLGAATNLPAIEPRTIFRDEQTRQYLTTAQAAALDDQQKQALKEVLCDEDRYYSTKYGTPLAYARPIEILGQSGLANVGGKRILDFGYGTIGHLRMLASLGADVTGVDVDSFLTALYGEPGDQGEVKSPAGRNGTITLVDGQFPADEKTKAVVGDGYDLIISKNTLKRGYIHPPPETQVDEKRLIELGVDDEAYVRALFDILKPGGRVMIYNLSPKQADLAKGEAYIPWADGHCPFDRGLLENVGSKVVDFDRDDSEAARAMADALGWDEDGMDLANDLFAHYTLAEKPAK